ncbi:MAG: hypothetical protein HZA94_02770 [Candidatus Vogelbacteria bacterium]|nr:hypothetical protein [Candidatus Vogelbacteria bacterium]
MKNKFSIILLPTTFLTSYLLASADSGTYKLLESVGTMAAGSTPEFKDYMTEILRVGIAIAGLLAVAELVFGGIQYVLSSASEKQAAAAKERIQNALIGLIIGISSVLILNVINPDILAGNLSIPDIPTGGTSSPTP